MIKYMQNRYIIALSTLLYCVCIGVLYSNTLNTKFVMLNSVIVFITVCLNVLTTSLFLMPINCFVNNIKLKECFGKLVKAIWISQMILVPISLILILLKTVIYLDMGVRVKIINFTMQYICPFVLFYAYKNVTKADWITTIKVVSIAFILLNLVIQIFRIS